MTTVHELTELQRGLGRLQFPVLPRMYGDDTGDEIEQLARNEEHDKCRDFVMS
jgi:hypothetical protein